MAFGGFFGGGSNNSNDDKNNSSSSTTLSNPDTISSNPLLTSNSSSSSSSNANSVKARLQSAITTESNIINAKMLISKINENCFDVCVPEPGASLSSRENACLSACMEKYIEGWSAVSKAYVGRLQKESASMGGAAAGGLGLDGFGGSAGGKELF